MFAATVQTKISFQALNWIKRQQYVNEIIMHVSIVCVSADVAWKQNILIIVVFIADSIPVVSDQNMVKQHKLDAVISINWICMKLELETAGIMCMNIVSTLPFCPLTFRYNAASAVLQPTHKAPAVWEWGALCTASIAVLKLSDTEQNNARARCSWRAKAGLELFSLADVLVYDYHDCLCLTLS